MKKMLLTLAAVAVFACLADTIEHDDLAPVRPAGDSNYYWNTASRPTVTLATASISVGGARVCDSVQAPSTNALQSVELRCIARDVSQGRNFSTAPVGAFIIMR